MLLLRLGILADWLIATDPAMGHEVTIGRAPADVAAVFHALAQSQWLCVSWDRARGAACRYIRMLLWWLVVLPAWLVATDPPMGHGGATSQESTVYTCIARSPRTTMGLLRLGQAVRHCQSLCLHALQHFALMGLW